MGRVLGVIATAIALTSCSVGVGVGTGDERAQRGTPHLDVPSTSTTTTTTTAPGSVDIALVESTSVAAPCPVVMPDQTREDLAGQTLPITRTHVVHEYPVSGASEDALIDSLDSCQPQLDNDGFDAATQWFVSWDYITRGLGPCRVRSPRVHLRVDEWLPKRVGTAGPALTAEWDRYLAALNVHEAGHELNGIAAATEVYQVLRDLPPSATCAETAAAANAAGEAAANKYSLQDEVYDQQTQHGATQGAVFP